MPEPGPVVSRVRGLGRILLSTLAGILLAELLGRALLPPPYANLRTNLTCDAVLGWRGLRNESFEYATDGYYHHRVAWNSRGFVDLERSVAKPAGVFRVLLLGDSMLEGAEVEGSRTWRAVLEEILNLDPPEGRRVEVMAAGVGGWSPAQQLLYFETEGRRYAPDLVVPLWNPRDDLGDMIPGRRMTAEFNCYSPSFVLCGGRLCPEPLYSAPGIPPWVDGSLVARRLNGYLTGIYDRSRVWQTAEARGLNVAWSGLADSFSPFTDTTRTDPRLKELYEVTVKVFSRLAREAQASGAATAFAIVPFKDAVLFEADERYRERFLKGSPRLRGMDPSLPNRVFGELMAAQGRAVIDLHADFAAGGAGARDLFWEEDIHFSPRGHQRMAEAMASRLREGGFVPGGARASGRLPEPRFILHEDVGGWSLLGYDADEERLARGEPADVTLHWMAPPGVVPPPSRALRRVTAVRWLQVVPQVRNLIEDGAFERGLAGFPLDLYAAPPGSRAVMRELRAGKATTVAVLDNRDPKGRSSLVTGRIAVRDDRLYLQSGWTRTRGGRSYMGRQWLPGGAFAYAVAAARAEEWKHHAQVLRPPAGSEAAQVWLLNYEAAGRACFDDVVFADLGEVDPGIAASRSRRP